MKGSKAGDVIWALIVATLPKKKLRKFPQTSNEAFKLEDCGEFNKESIVLKRTRGLLKFWEIMSEKSCFFSFDSFLIFSQAFLKDFI